MTERLLATLVKNLTDRLADSPLNFFVQIDTPTAQLTCQVPSDGRLTSPAITGQKEMF
jgi:hypothetical protein